MDVGGRLVVRRQREVAASTDRARGDTRVARQHRVAGDQLRRGAGPVAARQPPPARPRPEWARRRRGDGCRELPAETDQPLRVTPRRNGRTVTRTVPSERQWRFDAGTGGGAQASPNRG